MIAWTVITLFWTAHMLVYFGYTFEKEATRLELGYSITYYLNTMVFMAVAITRGIVL